MAALSARCFRSLARSSLQISRSSMSTNGVSQTRCISSLVGRTILRDCGLLRTIARDNLSKNLARRYTRMSAAVSMVVFNPVPLEQNCESDDDSLEAVCGDDDETFSCCEDAIPGL
ncbi:uncharacterized protein [Montipora capricornis]|uniref:uncharacterized protein isoform X2 n=1 Tax=Montipora capricornis TaxID=246305 RepID=UPI0035F16615